MTGQDIKNSILQAAIQGQLVSNELLSEEMYGEDLLNDIKRKKESIYKDGLVKKSRIVEKESLTDYIFEIPDNWIWCRLGDVCHIAGRIGFRGYTKEDIVSSNGAISLSPSNIIDGKISFLRYTMISMEKYEESPEIMVRDGEIVFTKTASIGKCAFIEKVPMPTTINPQMVVLKHIGCDARYLTFVLQSPYAIQNYNAFVIGTSIPTFSQAVLESLLIPLPPISIQKAIVSKIDSLFPIVDEYDKAAGELKALNEILPDKLRKSVLQEAIHGNLVSNDIPEGEATAAELLQQILKERQDRENKEKGKKAKKLTLSAIEEEPWELPEGWCWCRGNDIFFPMESIKPTADFVYIDTDAVNNKKNIIDNPKNVLLKDAPSRATRKLHTNDILFSMVRPYLKNIAYVDERFSSAIGTTGFYVITTSNYIFQPYLFKLMLSDYVVSGLTEYMKGDNSPSINNGHIENFLYPLPPLSIQHRIVEKLEEVLAAIEKLK